MAELLVPPSLPKVATNLQVARLALQLSDFQIVPALWALVEYHVHNPALS
jgi:hypothetical protein